MKKVLVAFIISIAPLACAMDIKEPAQSPALRHATPEPMEIDQSKFPIIQYLPPELLQPILLKTVQEPTLDQAVKNFAQATAVNRQTMAFRHDPQFNGIIIQALQERFPQEKLEDIVIKMNTKEALDWYLRKFPEKNTQEDLKVLRDKAVAFKRWNPTVILGPKLQEHQFNWRLYLAVHNDNLEEAKRWLSSGKTNPNSINAVNYQQRTMLELAAETNNIPMTRLLLSAGADPNLTTNWAGTAQRPLDKASENRNLALVDILLQAGAKPQHSDWPTLLSAASTPQNTAILQRLLDAGADINFQAPDYDATALMHAAIKGDLDNVQFLLQKGANPLLKSHNNTAKEYALREGHTHIVELLEQAEQQFRLSHPEGTIEQSASAAAGACPR